MRVDRLRIFCRLEGINRNDTLHGGKINGKVYRGGPQPGGAKTSLPRSWGRTDKNVDKVSFTPRVGVAGVRFSHRKPTPDFNAIPIKFDKTILGFEIDSRLSLGTNAGFATLTIQH